MDASAKQVLDDPLGQWARDAQAGDLQAQRELLLALQPRIRNLVRYLVRGDADVDDFAQEAMVAVIRGLPTFAGRGTVKSWADRITARKVFALIKKRTRARELPRAFLRGVPETPKRDAFLEGPGEVAELFFLTLNDAEETFSVAVVPATDVISLEIEPESDTGRQLAEGRFLFGAPSNIDRVVCVELQLRLDSPAEGPGRLALFVDGILDAELDGFVTNNATAEVGRLSIVPSFPGNPSSEAQIDRDLRMDDVVVSRNRIGCP